MRVGLAVTATTSANGLMCCLDEVKDRDEGFPPAGFTSFKVGVWWRRRDVDHQEWRREAPVEIYVKGYWATVPDSVRIA